MTIKIFCTLLMVFIKFFIIFIFQIDIKIFLTVTPLFFDLFNFLYFFFVHLTV